MKQTHFRQRPSRSGQSRMALGLELGRRVGARWACLPRKVRRRSPLRDHRGCGVLRLWRPPHAAPERPWTGVPGASSGLGGECHCGPGSAPLRRAPAMPSKPQPRLLRVPAPGSAAPGRAWALLPSPLPRPPLYAASPWALALARGAARLRGLSAGAEDVSLAFFQTPTKFRSKSFGDSLSLPKLWEEEVANAPLPSRGPWATARRTRDASWLRSPHRPWSLCRQPALEAIHFCITSEFSADLYPCTPAPPGNL